MARTLTTYLILLMISLFSVTVRAGAQQQGSGYELIPAPDLWYNDVDGIRVGIRLKGQVPGTYEDGPHRLNLGVWLGTWLPANPVSYYLEFTEPIQGLSDFGSEANVRLVSSLRTGFQQHGATFSKRWQKGFEEMKYTEFSLGFRVEQRTDKEYLPYPQLWQDELLYLADMSLLFRNENGLGTYLLGSRHTANIGGEWDPFVQSRVEFRQLIPLNEYFSFRGRIFAGVATNNSAPEYRFANSFAPPRDWMDHGQTRAKGTIPTPWMESGIFQVSGGPNLRGYLGSDFEALNNGLSPLFTSAASANFELDYPNPLDRALKKIPVLGDLMELRSYLFFDAGTSLGLTALEEKKVSADAGPGFMFSLNIPDYLGKPRGVVIRYDVPLWLSHPGSEPSFKWRNVVGIGAVFNL